MGGGVVVVEVVVRGDDDVKGKGISVHEIRECTKCCMWMTLGCVLPRVVTRGGDGCIEYHA